MSSIGRRDISDAANRLGIAGRPLCVHASVSSFGYLKGGAAALVQGLLDAECTVLVPTFTDLLVSPPPEMRPPRNGWNYLNPPVKFGGVGSIYNPQSNCIAKRMGAVAAAVLAYPQRRRGDHALCSFSAVGPIAETLVRGQTPMQPFEPLEELVRHQGIIVLMGVGLERTTIFHLAEWQAGRTPFCRWANGPEGRPIMLAVGGCSRGFSALEEPLSSLWRSEPVGSSHWRLLTSEAVSVTADAIRRRPEITHCGNSACLRCTDAVNGGPLLTATESKNFSAAIKAGSLN